ncbi:hypothetical protein VKA52_06300 [Halobacillus sp. HZG1]|nr:hypothetical protein [Halobacillus sp. HZG1]MEC3883331.1 hypothetical protein [Halobacillus sp. HZG1]
MKTSRAESPQNRAVDANVKGHHAENNWSRRIKAALFQKGVICHRNVIYL